MHSPLTSPQPKICLRSSYMDVCACMSPYSVYIYTQDSFWIDAIHVVLHVVVASDVKTKTIIKFYKKN